MKIFLFLFCFFSFCTPAFASETTVTPSRLPTSLSPDYIVPGYCIFRQEILAYNDDIYICTDVVTFTYKTSQSQTHEYLYSNCWSSFQNNTNSFGSKSSGIPLKKDLSVSFTLPPAYNTCVLKSVSENQICTTPLDVNSIVRSAFSQRFPLDLFDGFQPATSSLSCPMLTITGQSFQLCYLKDLVASLKYVLLLVFIVSSVISL
jgi:hypothetical protein